MDKHTNEWVKSPPAQNHEILEGMIVDDVRERAREHIYRPLCIPSSPGVVSKHPFLSPSCDQMGRSEGVVSAYEALRATHADEHEGVSEFRYLELLKRI